MQAETWERTKEILGEVLDLEAAKRNAYLAKLQITNEIRWEIESLLAAEAGVEDFLTVPASGFCGDFFKDEKTNFGLNGGQTIGPYRTIKELGLGGMGAVYLAERQDGKFEQKVAIKLLKREFNVGKPRESFQREIDIQSKLVHPNVATILDTGSTGEGIPYIVMEYVDGSPIDAYSRDNDLGLKDRLKLFNKVCDAVAFAHQNLIVHRDLKPSNILVTRDGNPKLLDFGIASLVGSIERSSGITLQGAMTPEYASPEQIKGETVSTATDIYSLGVVLFKLLTGTYPFKIKTGTNGHLLKQITENEPTLPSRAAAVAPRSPVKSARLAGDLDTIILKALRNDPDERYRTVEQFSEDIWRSLDGQPVHARPSTFAYRANRFIRRNRISVIAGCLIVFSLIAGTAAALWQANKAGAQSHIAFDARQAAEIESANAKAEQAKSEKISKFMAKIISYANPSWYAEGSRFGGEAKVIDALNDLSGKIDIEFAGEADIQAELHHKFGEVYLMATNSGAKQIPELQKEYIQKHTFHFLRAIELRKQYYGERHELVAKDLFYAYAYITEDQRERAKMLADAIQMMRETNPLNLNLPYMLEGYTAMLILPKNDKLSEVYRQEAIPRTSENRYDLAERYYRESLPVFRLHYKEENSAIYSNECRLAYTLARQGKWADFNEHFSICKLGVSLASTPAIAEALRRDLDLVEKALVPKDVGE